MKIEDELTIEEIKDGDDSNSIEDYDDKEDLC